MDLTIKKKCLWFQTNRPFSIEIYLPYHLTMKPEMRYVGHAFLFRDSDNNTEKLDSYTLFDFYLTYKPKVNKLNFQLCRG
jgi:hypothetical protein